MFVHVDERVEITFGSLKYINKWMKTRDNKKEEHENTHEMKREKRSRTNIRNRDECKRKINTLNRNANGKMFCILHAVALSIHTHTRSEHGTRPCTGTTYHTIGAGWRRRQQHQRSRTRKKMQSTVQAEWCVRVCASIRFRLIEQPFKILSICARNGEMESTGTEAE